MAPASPGVPVASTESVVVVVRALVGVGGDEKLTMSGVVTTSLANVTAPIPIARARPSIELPAPTVMAPLAMMFPENDAVAPIVTAPSTSQKTLEACAPLIKSIALEAAGLSAPLIWKTNTALGSPWPFSVMVTLFAMAAPAK